MFGETRAMVHKTKSFELVLDNLNLFIFKMKVQRCKYSNLWNVYVLTNLQNKGRKLRLPQSNEFTSKVQENLTERSLVIFLKTSLKIVKFFKRVSDKPIGLNGV